ncbi:FAD-binding oxidoreductase [Pseudonocardia sp. TRM90224]|uniref:FAD-binding oxidoreductase n=1 Tax=Pseudonocardia sp. TRM90224 TaxID=2812678 RepID=UPI001E5C836E|nr:FAD-binding oxidoreductase [Pseudonocardia sp. TRM90224]
MSTSLERSLRSLVRGGVHARGDVGYETACALHNGAAQGDPAVVVRPCDVTDVQNTLLFARSSGLVPSVRGGGHGVVGHATKGDVVIDLSGMRRVQVDADARTAVVQGGALWGDVDIATQVHGLAVPGGRISHTGVGGLTLGGGEGWLSCRHGLTSDNLISVDLVTADGRVVVASAERNPELFWALRGGGGNFGVATSFTFRVHPIGPRVLGGMLAFPLAAASRVFELVEQLFARGSDDFAGAVGYKTAPPAPFVPGHLVGRPMLVVIPAWFGDVEDGERFIAPLRDRVVPLIDAVSPMPYTMLQSMLDPGSPRGLRNRWTSGFVPSVMPGLVEAMEDAACAMPSAFSQILLVKLPEAVRRIPDDATAFPSRSGRWLVHPVGAWSDPAGDAAGEAWVAGLGAAIRASGETGTYLNVDQAGADRMRWALGEQRYRRLQEVKRTWDPGDTFRHCAHIPPA